MSSIAKQKKTSSIAAIILYIFLIGFALTCIYPLIWLLINSFKNDAELFSSPWTLPSIIRVGNFKKAWVSGYLGTSFINSTFVTLVSVSVTILISSMAAFSIKRLKWKLSGLVLGVFLIGVMIPVHATLIPLFMVFGSLHFLNNAISLILPYIAFALPISVFILTGFMGSFPKEIEEAAVMDGSGMAGVFFRIILPLCKSSIATITIYNFVAMWNELLYALIFMSDPKRMTLAVSLTRFKGQYEANWSVQLAATVIMVIPSIIVYMFLNDKIIEGMTVGAVKG